MTMMPVLEMEINNEMLKNEVVKLTTELIDHWQFTFFKLRYLEIQNYCVSD